MSLGEMAAAPGQKRRALAVASLVIGVLSVYLAMLAIGIQFLNPSRVGRVGAYEAAIIGDIRALIAAQASYRRVNAGQYDTLECLASPARCIPNYASNQPSFVDRSMVEQMTRHYRRTFHPGPPSDPQGRGTQYSPSSLTAYAYVAEPVEPGRTVVRAFCGDDTGMICYASSGQISPVKDGRCPRDCKPLE